MRVFIFGAGKVGSVLGRALRRSGAEVTLRAARSGVPRAMVDADLLVLAVRDADLPPIAEALVGRVSSRTPVVHCAGALGPEVLAPLRGRVSGLGQMHPMISFASARLRSPLDGGYLTVRGDPAAIKASRALARRLGMTARTGAHWDPVGYHAAAALVANGGASLAAAGARLLGASGVPLPLAAKMLGRLLASVAANVTELGFPGSLTGPVRRGEAEAVRRHRSVIGAKTPDLLPLYDALVSVQIELARQIGEAPEALLERIYEQIAGGRAPGPEKRWPRAKRSR